MRVAVVGTGRLGLQLAAALAATGRAEPLLRGRCPPPSHRPASLEGVPWDHWDEPRTPLDAAVSVLAVPDRAIAAAAELLAASEDLRGRVVLHVSGVLPAAILEPCRRAGAAVASWHPLQSFPPLTTGAVRWQTVAVAVEGDPRAEDAGFRLARLLGARPWRIDPDAKPLYHAAASVAANLTHVLVAEAAAALERCGLDSTAAREALRPLVETSLAAALDARGLERLTGPLARGDDVTVARHLGVLPADLADVYRAVAALVRARRGSGTSR